MKILHINAGLESGGGLTHIINLLAEAKKEGLDFALLVFAEGPVAKAARAAQLEVHVLGASGRYDFSSLRRLTAFINHGHYDIVHTHGARANLYLSLIKRKITARWCVTVHSDPYLDFAGRGIMGKIFTQLNLRALKKADWFFTVTKRFKKLLVTKAKIQPAKVYVIYNGIFFHTNNSLPPKEEHRGFNLINVARAEKVKGQDLLLRAVKNINNPDIHLYFAGDGSELSKLKSLTQELELTDQVTFLGFLTQEQLTELYRRMDLAVLASYSESFPLVLLEASDNLVPLLSTAVGDIEMMIPDRQHGFVAKIGDLTSLTAGLRTALEMNDQELVAMAKREKDYLVHNFAVKQQLAVILRVYERYLKA